MKFKYSKITIYIISLLSVILFIYFSVNYLIKKPYEIINFVDSDIHEDFEIEITNNLYRINNYLKEYLFIESHLFKREDNEINIKINLKKPFAINNLTNEVIFYDNTKASIRYFRKSYLEKIKLKEDNKGVLSGVPASLPPLVKAYRMQEKAAGVGFDWQHINGVVQKIEEELRRVKQKESNV